MKTNSLIRKILRLNKIKFKSKNVKNIEVGFTDFSGNLREIIIPKSKLKDAVSFGLKCDGSSVKMNNVENSDLNIFLDIKSAYILPNKNLFFIANTSHEFDTRKKLIQIEKIKNQEKLKVNIGIELEFFLMGNLKDNLGYFETNNSVEFLCLNEIMNFCETINFPIENLHHECGHSQFEINFKYNISHKTADNLIYLKKIILFFAQKYELNAFFSPKPFDDECGSGMHTNISVFKKSKNLFYDKNDKLNLSKFAYSFANGITCHIRAITAISNPTDESYKRLIAGNETPQKIDICGKNRMSLIRVPTSNKLSTRLEFRLPDCSSNPYLLFSSIILAGFDFSESSNSLSKKLPNDLLHAKKYLANDKLFNSILPQKNL